MEDQPPGASPQRVVPDLPVAGLRALRAAGADVETFLQGQLSGDLRALTPARAMWTSYNSPKGRMLALPLMVRSGDGIDLWLPAALLAAVQKRMRMFVLRSKVGLEDLGASRVAVALDGPAVEPALRAAGVAVPWSVREVAVADGVEIVRCLGASARFLALGAPDRLAALGLGSGQDDEARRRGDIEAGVPVVVPATQDHWVAQMANLDLLGGIGFEKGCYTGQEVVARLHYLGNLKRRMFRLDGRGGPPAPGTAVHGPGGDGQSVGEIVDAVSDGRGGFVASAVLQVAQAGTDGLVVAGSPCRPATEYRYPP